MQRESVNAYSIEGIEQRNYANVLGVTIDAVEMEKASAMVAAQLSKQRKNHVCFVDVHGILEALKRSVA